MNMMYLCTILSLLICAQLIVIASSNPHEQLNTLLQTGISVDGEDFPNINSDSDEENEFDRRANAFLRFGRQISPSAKSFLRFGRSSNPAFLRFGRGGGNTGAKFLRFGRRSQVYYPNTYHRFARKGEFLRFG